MRASTDVADLADDAGDEVIWQSERTRVLRRRHPGDGSSVVLKQAIGPEAQRRLRHEAMLLERLAAVDGVPRVVSLPGVAGLAMRDEGGRSLAHVLEQGRLALHEALRIAHELARLLAQVHRHGIVHKDINPTNVLLVGTPPRPRLIDFNIASSFAEERPGFTHQDEIAGTLAYMAPEQTGRTGRAVDQRADLYAFGVTLYELVTGHKPFRHEDPLELIYAHLVHLPTRPDEIDVALPVALSDLVMRLLEKDAERRYQSAEGLASDLARLIERLAAGDRSRFTLGERDFALQLSAPSRLIGRDAEIATLQSAFERALHSRDGALIVSGAPGVGKTALVNELRPLVTARRGWFVAGKFDQYRRDAGSGAVLQALRGLGRMLLSEPELELAELRERLLAGLDSNAGLAATVLPEIAPLLGVPPEAMPEDPLQAEARLLQLGLSTLQAIASTSRPVVMVIDDLQWAARSSIAFFDAVLTDDRLQGVMLIGIYREAEVDAAHPLTGMLDRLHRLDPAPTRMALRNLPAGDLAALLGEMLRLPTERAAELADAVMPRTGGNPYDTVELVNALRRDGALLLADDGWRWEPETIRRFVGQGDVVDLLEARIAALPSHARQAIDAMACLGGEVPLALLCAAAGASVHELEQMLRPALEDGLLVMSAGPDGSAAVRFRHDRVQQAAYGRLELPAARLLHLEIARRLASHEAFSGPAAEQYLPSVDSVNEAGERRRVAMLFRKAAGSAPLISYVASERFLAAAVNLMKPVATEADLAFVIGLEADRHAALYCLGRHVEADDVFRSIESRCTDLLVFAQVTGLHLTSLTSRGRQEEAVALGLAVLRRLAEHSEDLQPQAAQGDSLARLIAWVDTLDVEADLQRPEVTDPYVLAAASLLNRIGPPAYFRGPGVFADFLFQAQHLWQRHGPCANLMTTLAMSPIVTISLGRDFRTGYRLARHTLAVSEARGYQPATAQMRTSYAFFATHWFEALDEGVRQMQLAREGLLPWGSLLTASLTYSGTLPVLVDSAAELDTSQAECDAGMVLSLRAANAHSVAFMTGYRQLLRALRGETSAPGSFADADFDEAAFLAGPGAHPTAGSIFHINRAMTAAIFGDVDRLVQHAAAAMPLASAQANYRSAQAHLLQGLALAMQAHRVTSAVLRSGALEQMQRCIDWLAARAGDSPGGYLHLVKWLEAEQAWASGDAWRAARAFDIALREAARRDRPWHRALMTERASAFHDATGLQQSGRQLLVEACRLYEAWGARGKVAQLVDAHPALRQPGVRRRKALTGSPQGPSTAVSADALDMLAILRASQALSSETSLERLETRVIELMGAMTGATRVTLALRRDGSSEWAVPDPDGGAQRIAVEEAGARRMLPLSAFRYVQRTLKPLLVEDARRDDRFIRDPYLAGLEQCSLLVVPILSHGEPRAMVVLENRQSQGAFAADRLDAVSLIAGQLAVSLDNAQLYASLERKVAERTQALEELNHRLERLSLTDPLTGVANRRRFNEALEIEWKRALRSGTSIGLAMIDIDQFKLYNDHYGHLGGDDCLRRVAGALSANVRPASDLAARYGGEEFAIVLPDTDIVGARAAAERLRAGVAGLCIPHATAIHGIVTISVGVAAFVPDEQRTSAGYLNLADAALYRAKNGGRNQVACAQAMG